MSGLRGDTAVYALALASERLLSFFLLPLLTTELSPAEYAIWSQTVVAVGGLTPLVLLGMQTALVKFLPLWEATPGVRDSMLAMMLTAIGTLLLLVMWAMSVAAPEVSGWLFGVAAHAVFVPFLALLLLSEVLFEFLTGILRAGGRIRRIAGYVLLKGVWRITFLLVALKFLDMGFAAALALLVWVQLVFVILMYFREVSLSGLVAAGYMAGRRHWRETLEFALPLLPLAGLTLTNNFADRFFLAHLRGLDELAAYAAAYSLAGIAILAYSVLGFTLFPALSRQLAANDRKGAARLLEQVVVLYLFFLLPFVAGLAVVGPDLLPLLTTADYVVSPWIFLAQGAVVGLFGLYQIGLYVTLLDEGSVRNLKPMLLAAALAVTGNAILVAPLGGLGAVLAGCIANIWLAGNSLGRAASLLSWRFPWHTLLSLVGRVLAMLGVVLLLGRALGLASLPRLAAVVSLAALAYLALDLLRPRHSILALLKSR